MNILTISSRRTFFLNRMNPLFLRWIISGSPLPNLDSEPNIFFCKTISDTTELLPATCYLQFKEKTIEIFIMKSSMKIVLLSLSSFSLCQLSYTDSILTIDFNYHALYAHRITLNLKDAEEAIVNQLISSISCLSQLTYQLVCSSLE